MHRCGTSLLTSSLVEDGYDIGFSKNKDVNWQNPKGYFENDKLTQFHNNLLSHNNVNWKTITEKKYK